MIKLRLRALLALSGISLLALSCGSSSSTSSPTPMADVTITIAANAGIMSYSPNPATARVGQTVAWLNTAGQAHTATQDGGRFDTGNLSNGTVSTPLAMNLAGSFPYHCTLHPSMVGTLIITP